MQTKMFLKVWINLLALLIAFVSSPVTAQNEIQLTICLGEQVYLAGAPSFAGPLALTDPIGPASGPCGVNTAGSQVCGIGQIQSGNPPEPMYHCNPSMTTINNASTDDYVDGNGWFVSPDENTSYVITTQYLSTLGSNGSCSSKEQVYNVVVEECSSQIVGEESTNENSDEPITQSLGQTNCSESGTIIYADCPPNGEYFFILKPDGTIIDPYYGTGITFNQYNGQEVNYSVSATFASPCSIASEAVTLDCIEDATIYDFNWVVDFPFLGTYIIGNCDGVTVDAYLASNGSFWLLVDTPANGPQLFFEDGSLYCSGVSCLLSYGITGAPVDTYICGDVVIPDNVVEFNVCAGSNVFLPDFNPEAYLPPFGLNACYPSTTISPTTNTGGQSFTPDPNVVYTVTTTIIGPDGVSCGFYSPGSVFSYQAVVNLDDCAACPDPGNCSDNICYNGTEIWNFENCECETIPNDCSENTTQLSTTICQGAETIAPQLPAPSPPSFCSPSSLLLLNTTIEPMIGVSVEPIGFVLSPSQTTTYVITDNYFSAPDLPCPNNFPVTLLYTVYVEDCASCPDLGTCNTDCTQGDIEVWDENICQCVTSTQSVWGCTDPDATNYNPQANCESSCFYPAGFNGMTICEGETVTLPAGCVNDVGPGCPGPVGPQGGIISPSVNTESFFDGFCNNINVTPTTTTTYTVTSFNGFTCSQETNVFTINVEDCTMPPPAQVVNIDLCWGDYTVLNYPTYTPPAGVTGCFPFPTIEPQIDLYSSCAFCPPPTNGVEVRPFESRTYELSLGDSVTSNPDCEAPASIIYNVNVELCDLSEFVIANNGSDNTTTCPSEYVVIGPYQLSDAVACPGPQFSFSPDPLGTYFSPAGLGSQVYFMVNPSTTTTYTYIDTPGCFGDTPQTTTVNVESCSGLQEIAICLGEEIQLAPPTFPTTPWWVGYQCIPQTTYVTASTGEALFVNQIITPQESATYTVTSNAALGTDQVYNCGSISITYDISVEDCNPPVTSACYDENALYPTIECDAYGYDPVCSCDNITYNNICEAYYLNGITSYTSGACVGGPTTCPDPGNCDDGICENGIESWNAVTCECVTTATDCVGPPIPAGCVDTSIIISNIDCQSYAYEPVCGCNGITYYNSCEAYWYNGVTSYTNGSCPNSPVNPPTEPPVQPGCYDANVLYDTDCSNDAYDPVCGCDNQTYDNICDAFYLNGITSYTIGACPNGYVETVDLFDERGVPFLICHEGLNRLGAEVISQSVTGLECGKINFVEGVCFQYLPYGDCATEEVRVSWVDENGLTESRDYKIVISEEQESVGIDSFDSEAVGIEVLYGDAGSIWIQQTANNFDEINYAVYSINGQLQMRSSSSDNRWMIDTSILVKGMYVITSSVGSARFVVR